MLPLLAPVVILRAPVESVTVPPCTSKLPTTATSAPLRVIAVALLDLISLPVTVKSPVSTALPVTLSG